ncbi:hypothetical protein GCM10008955_10540 [Deinococcus malanensis]|uniref:Uncharacterized protein n=1 Tax=Deinococcus malanensis TaxID=1706855 RepID=A0ABQ2EP30_9DEIO|nr:hypothetical protein [Deinococcus malanensis]GGK19012.1 hypothetical protein GCM10008955_10540 [Deinococcus malanensis]
MNTIRILTSALALLAPLAVTAQAQTQRAVLSGSTLDMPWTVYGPGFLQGLSENAVNLRLASPPNSQILGVKYGNRTITLAARTMANLNSIYTHHDIQLREQGFERVSVSVDGDVYRSVYSRANDTVEMRVAKSPGNSYRATFNLSGVQAGTQGNTSLLLRDSTPGQLGYVLYGPVMITDQLRNDPARIQLSVPAGAVVDDVDQENEDFTVKVRSGLTLAQMNEFYREQFAKQGFNRTSGGALERDKVAAVYERGQNRLEWSAEREGNDTYEILFNFEGARDGNN